MSFMVVSRWILNRLDDNVCRTIDECYDILPDHTEDGVTSVTEAGAPGVRVRPLYIVTPTYARPTQLAGEPLTNHRALF